MLYRSFAGLMVAVAAVTFSTNANAQPPAPAPAGPPAVAPPKAAPKTPAKAAETKKETKDAHEHGEFVKADSSSITVTSGKDKKEATHTLADKVKVTIDGKEGKAADLKAGTKVTLTLNADKKVTAISTDKPKAPKK